MTETVRNVEMTYKKFSLRLRTLFTDRDDAF